MKSILTLALILFATLLNAQESIPISLENVLKLGGANNLTIKEFQERQNLAAAHAAKAKEWWLPEFYAGAQTHQYWGAAMNGNGNFFLDVNRNNLWLGLGLKANWNFAEGIYAAKAAKFRNRASVHRTEAEKNKTLLKSITIYYELMSAQLNFIAYSNLVKQADTIAQQIQIQVEAGKRYESEMLLAKSNRNHLKLEMLNAQKMYRQASAELLKQLNLAQSIKLVSVDSSLMPLDYTLELTSISEELYKNRGEIKAKELEIKSLQIQKKNFTTGLLIPQLSIGANTSYFGKLNDNVDPMDPIRYTSPDQLYPTSTINASLLWQIPLGAFIYKGDSKKYSSLIRLKKIETEQLKAFINEEITRASIQVKTGKQQIEIAKEALKLSSEALKQSIERQQFGTAKPFEVFQTQQFYIQSQIDYLKVVSEFNTAQFTLKVAKGETL
ncbi:MAG: TolC family protein [Flavobacteriales bacterium]|nr:TolC family protein [Flavobacteriales bacterium]